jgi:hypothetical protein
MQPKSAIDRLREILKDKSYLTAKEITRLGLVKSEATLSAWRARGLGPAFIQMSPGKIIYEKDELLLWLQSCCVPQKTDPQVTTKADSENKKQEIHMQG